MAGNPGAATGGGEGGGNLTVQGLPIIKPPYGVITALDMHDGRWRTARPEAETVDVDGQAPNLAGEGTTECVADRGVDLARHLGDRHAIGDGQIELDVEGLPEVDDDPRVREAESTEESLERAPGEARDAV